MLQVVRMLRNLTYYIIRARGSNFIFRRRFQVVLQTLPVEILKWLITYDTAVILKNFWKCNHDTWSGKLIIGRVSDV